MRSLRIPALAALLVLATASPALAAKDQFSTLKNSSVHATRPAQLDINLILGFFFGDYNHIGVSGWYGFPIVPDGFFPKLNDALFIEAGAALERYSWDPGFICEYSWWRLTPMGGARYNMYLTEEWTAFATLKTGIGFGFADDVDCGAGFEIGGGADYTELVIDTSIGAYWQMSKDWQLRLELGYFGATIGAGMQL